MTSVDVRKVSVSSRASEDGLAVCAVTTVGVRNPHAAGHVTEYPLDTPGTINVLVLIEGALAPGHWSKRDTARGEDAGAGQAAQDPRGKLAPLLERRIAVGCTGEASSTCTPARRRSWGSCRHDVRPPSPSLARAERPDAQLSSPRPLSAGSARAAPFL